VAGVGVEPVLHDDRQRRGRICARAIANAHLPRSSHASEASGVHGDAVVMENFAWACANLIQENHNARTPPNAEHPGWEIALPELLSYPEDADGWRAIAPKLAGRVFGLRNKLHESKSTIRNIIEFNKAELGWVLDEQAASRGLEAWRMAIDLRRTYGIEAVELEWNYPDYLKTALDTAVGRREDHRKRNAGSVI
jgi:hypothetical protein